MELRHRPQYHFVPVANWMNDPNGLIQWKGVYHLFYQHHPHGSAWGPMHWGHACSRDLVHWKHLPIALAPTPEGPDKDGVWSGCAVNHAGVPTLIYTGVRPEVQCLATSDDEMIVWHKEPSNPVIAGPPEGLDVTGFRDPCVWWEDEGWYMVLGSGIRGVGGAILLYRSSDLRVWEYLGPLFEGQTEEEGHNWECPNYFPLGDQRLLIISPEPFRHARYYLGDMRALRFIPRTQGLLDHGGLYYAPQVFIDERGRRLCFGWLLEDRTPEAAMAAGWAGVQSLARELILSPTGDLEQRPVPELATLRGEHHSLAGRRWSGTQVLPNIRGTSLELDLQIEPGEAGLVGVEVLRSDQAEERTVIGYDVTRQRLYMDTRGASLDAAAPGRLAEASLALDGGPLRLRIFVDHSVVEVFANERICLTGRPYPSRDDALSVALVASGDAHLRHFDAWDMASIWTSSD